jgi:hypothetical protein
VDAIRADVLSFWICGFVVDGDVVGPAGGDEEDFD